MHESLLGKILIAGFIIWIIVGYSKTYMFKAVTCDKETDGFFKLWLMSFAIMILAYWFFGFGICYLSKEAASDEFPIQTGIISEAQTEGEHGYLTYIDKDGDVQELDICDSDIMPLQPDKAPYVERITEKFLFIYKYRYKIHIGS